MRLAWFLAASLAMALMVAAPTTAHAQEEEDDAPKAEDFNTGNSVSWGLGARVRYVTMPTWLQNLFVQHSMPMNSAGFGLEAVRRKGNFDIVFGLEYETIAPQEGYYLDNGYSSGPITAADLDYVTFDGLALIGLDVNFLWHAEINPMFSIRYGGGLGVGIVLGDVLQETAECPSGPPISELDDPNTTLCTHDGVPVVSADVPPAVPIVNILLGLRIKITEEINLNIEGGFRDMLFLGGGVNYFF